MSRNKTNKPPGQHPGKEDDDNPYHKLERLLLVLTVLGIVPAYVGLAWAIQELSPHIEDPLFTHGLVPGFVFCIAFVVFLITNFFMGKTIGIAAITAAIVGVIVAIAIYAMYGGSMPRLPSGPRWTITLAVLCTVFVLMFAAISVGLWADVIATWKPTRAGPIPNDSVAQPIPPPPVTKPTDPIAITVLNWNGRPTDLVGYQQKGSLWAIDTDGRLVPVTAEILVEIENKGDRDVYCNGWRIADQSQDIPKPRPDKFLLVTDDIQDKPRIFRAGVVKNVSLTNTFFKPNYIINAHSKVTAWIVLTGDTGQWAVNNHTLSIGISNQRPAILIAADGPYTNDAVNRDWFAPADEPDNSDNILMGINQRGAGIGPRWLGRGISDPAPETILNEKKKDFYPVLIDREWLNAHWFGIRRDGGSIKWGQATEKLCFTFFNNTDKDITLIGFAPTGGADNPLVLYSDFVDVIRDDTNPKQPGKAKEARTVKLTDSFISFPITVKIGQWSNPKWLILTNTNQKGYVSAPLRVMMLMSTGESRVVTARDWRQSNQGIQMPGDWGIPADVSPDSDAICKIIGDQ